jgi:hypothetical protein
MKFSQYINEKKDHPTHTYIDDTGKKWKRNDLLKLTEGIPIKTIKISFYWKKFPKWKIENIHDLSIHYNRIKNANLKYPLIVMEDKILDGWHRLVKAYSEGKSTIKAIEVTREAIYGKNGK